MSLPHCPVRDLACEGTAFDIGAAQGEQFREQIRLSLKVLTELEAVNQIRPALLPLKLFVWIAEHKAQRLLRSIFSAVPISAGERLQGLAAGAAVPIRKLALCSAMESVFSDLTKVTAAAVSAGCSAMAATGRRSASGEPILAHNFDYLPVLQQFYFIRRTSPDGGLRSVDLAFTSIPGAIDGVNEAGLSIACNYAYAIDKGPVGPTVTMLIAEALSRCRTISETVEYFRSTPRIGGGLLMLGDAGGRIAALELSNTRVEVREATEETLFHTNRYCHHEMAANELDDGVAYAAGAPRVLRGRIVHQASSLRDARFRELIAAADTLTPTSLQQVMGDHGADDAPCADTICMHGEYWFTTASIQLLPAERKLRASFSPTCVAEYQDFTLTGSPTPQSAAASPI
jgi:hypothetical protein